MGVSGRVVRAGRNDWQRWEAHRALRGAHSDRQRRHQNSRQVSNQSTQGSFLL